MWNLVSGAPAAERGPEEDGSTDLVGQLSIRVTRKGRSAVASRGADTAIVRRPRPAGHPPAQRSAAAAALRTGARVEEQQSHCYRHNDRSRNTNSVREE